VTKQVEGIILKTTDYQEKSKILQVMTKEHGLISVIMKGASQYKSQAYRLAQPITHAFLSIYYQEGLSSCFSGEVMSNFQSLKIDFQKNVYVYHLFELILKSVEKHQPIPYVYDCLLAVITAIDEIDDPIKIGLFTLVFEIKLLYFLGVAPQLDVCVECGQDKGIIDFDVYKGGLLCRNCQTNPLATSMDTIKLLMRSFYLNLDELMTLEATKHQVQELRQLIDAYYDFYLGLKTNSRKYMTLG
jgi:DNA repair protein RecO (recombination protein O)